MLLIWCAIFAYFGDPFEQLIPFLEYVLRARAAKPWGRLGGLQLPQFLTFARRRFVRIIGCSAASHASPLDRISVPPPLLESDKE